MQIFCKETQAHLDMNPHLKEQGLEAANNGANLITPDLWLRNCRSRSASPSSTLSVSPQPAGSMNQSNERPSITPPTTTTAACSSSSSMLQNTTSNHKPLISVAPVSKLMSKSPVAMQQRLSPKHNRKKRPVRTPAAGGIGANRADSKTTNSSSNMTTQNFKAKSLLSSLNETSKHTNLNQAATPSLTQFAASCVQDLHMNVPPLSPMLDSHLSQHSTPHALPTTGRNAMPQGFFAASQLKQNAPTLTQDSYAARPPHPPPAFHANAGFLPRFYGDFLPTAAAPQLMQPTALNALIGTPPPVTLMVPYPVIIPLPIPIPVPLPIVDFYKAHLLPEERKKFDEERKLHLEASLAEAAKSREKSLDNAEFSDKPLDFRKTKATDDENAEKPCCTEASAANELAPPCKLGENEILTEQKLADTTQSSLSSSSPAAPSKTPECSLETAAEPSDEDTHNKNESQFSTSSTSICNFTDDTAHNPDESLQKLPKLKITRLQTKRTLTQTKESECSRPLRKRKRLINCDFQKFSSSLKDNTNSEMEAHDETQQQQQQQSKDLDKSPNIKK